MSVLIAILELSLLPMRISTKTTQLHGSFLDDDVIGHVQYDFNIPLMTSYSIMKTIPSYHLPF